MSDLRYSYVTNGLADHRLDEALALLADNGYAGVGLTLDHQHLDTSAPDLVARVARIAKRLSELGLAVVVETGGRFVLDPKRKHEPTMLSDCGRERRVEFLQTAVRIAADLGAEAVSFWSGRLSSNPDPALAWARLVEGCEQVLQTADEYGVDLAFEPEPGMFLQYVHEWEALAADLGDHERFGITLDVGHCHCIEDLTVADCIRQVGRRLRNVQIEDMKRGVHEHLAFGEGTMDFPPVLAALREIDYQGLVSVELSRHSHTAHTMVPQAIEFLRKAEAE